MHNIFQVGLKFSHGPKSASASLTLLEVTSSATPRGMKAMPMAKKAGSTVLAVSIGCQAGNFCCLNFVSAKNVN